MLKEFYIFHMILIAIIAYFTGEIVTFIMLAIVVKVLHNIHITLKQISNKLDQTTAVDEIKKE
ncbi:hypothetical protein Q5Y73_07120 [Chengkuizengella sp. 2205SS18-9]|uniref:Uncharacterized protein n=2 Tax=Chengkuizengella axinellae TaxID=3064388 RepID=A0ABT9IYI3_9BACL|nr:hypothetical protein [Chengkuizengella sp. 2205SS18-9]MDP5273870.1 hypothetical protein [Chengkuizengella sp. 2205SS18-9]